MHATRRILAAGFALAFCSGVLAQPRPADGALVSAAGGGDVPAVKRLLAQGASVAARDGRKRTPLLAATQGNHVAAAQVLIEAGADVNAQDDLRDSAFLLAGAEGYLEILRLTLKHGADLKSVNRYGGTALIPACHHGHVETVRELLNTAIAIDHVNNLGWTALLEAVILGNGGPRYVEIVQLLVDHRANVNLADREGVGPLAHAKRRGYTGIATILERAGAR